MFAAASGYPQPADSISAAMSSSMTARGIRSLTITCPLASATAFAKRVAQTFSNSMIPADEFGAMAAVSSSASSCVSSPLTCSTNGS